MIEPGDLVFSEEEVVALRRYLLNGGFLMVNDFWGDDEYENFHRADQARLPRPPEPTELPLDHEIFRCVYRLKEKPQVPSIARLARAPATDLRAAATAATPSRSTTGGSSTTRGG